MLIRRSRAEGETRSGWGEMELYRLMGQLLEFVMALIGLQHRESMQRMREMAKWCYLEIGHAATWLEVELAGS